MQSQTSNIICVTLTLSKNTVISAYFYLLLIKSIGCSRSWHAVWRLLERFKHFSFILYDSTPIRLRFDCESSSTRFRAAHDVIWRLWDDVSLYTFDVTAISLLFRLCRPFDDCWKTERVNFCCRLRAVVYGAVELRSIEISVNHSLYLH